MTVFTSEDAKVGPDVTDIKYLYDDSLFETDQSTRNLDVGSTTMLSRYSVSQDIKRDGTLAPSRALAEGLQDLPTILKTYKHPAGHAHRKNGSSHTKQSSSSSSSNGSTGNNNPISVEEILLINERNLKHRDNPIPILPTGEVEEFFYKKAISLISPQDKSVAQGGKLKEYSAASELPGQKDVKRISLSTGKSTVNTVITPVQQRPPVPTKKQIPNSKSTHVENQTQVGRRDRTAQLNGRHTSQAQSNTTRRHKLPVGPSGIPPPGVPPPPPDTPPGFAVGSEIHSDSERLAQELYETFCGSTKNDMHTGSLRLCDTSRISSIHVKPEQRSMDHARNPNDKRVPSNRTNFRGRDPKLGEYLVVNRGLKDRVEEYNEFLTMQRMRAKKRQERRAAAMIQRTKPTVAHSLGDTADVATKSSITTTATEQSSKLNSDSNSRDLEVSGLPVGRHVRISTVVVSPTKAEDLSFSHSPCRRTSKFEASQDIIEETESLKGVTTTKSETQQSLLDAEAQNIVTNPLPSLEHAEEDITSRIPLDVRHKSPSVGPTTNQDVTSLETDTLEVGELVKRVSELERLVSVLSREIDVLKRVSPVYRTTAKKFVVRNVSSRDL